MKKLSVVLGVCALLAAPAFANEKVAKKEAAATAAPAVEATATTDAAPAAPANSKKLKKGHKKHAKKKGAAASDAPATN